MASTEAGGRTLTRGNELVARLRAGLGRSQPERAPKLLCAATRVAFPGSRCDLVVRRGRAGRREWAALVSCPGTPALTPWPAGIESGLVAGARSLDVPILPGDSELAALGHAHRMVVPVRFPGARAFLSVARSEAFVPADLETARILARTTEPMLSTLARLERLERTMSSARFTQRLTAAINRSLLLDDILRSTCNRLSEQVALDRALLVVSTGETSELMTFAADATDRFQSVALGRHPARAQATDRLELLREATITADLAQLRAHDTWQQELLDAGMRSVATLPLVARRRLAGALILASEKPDAFDAATKALLRPLARPLSAAVDKARLFREASERSRLMTALYEVGQALNSPLDVAGVTERVLSILHEAFRIQHSAVLALEHDSEGGWLVLLASRGYSRRDDGSFRMRVGDRGITSRAVRTGRLVYVPDVRQDPHYVRGVESGRSEVAVPLLAGGRVVGVLDVESTEVGAFAPQDLETLKLFSTQVALALVRARSFDEVRRQAMVDGLSGLLNQRYFREKVEREIDRSQRTGRPFVLALLDIDDFATINDAHGHVAGDQAITTIGEVLRARIRSIDAAARFGGDEFALILSETDEAAGVSVVADIREELRRRPIPGGPVTFSAGVTEWSAEMLAMRDVVSSADRALYRAKDLGKDMTVPVSAMEPAPPA